MEGLHNPHANEPPDGNQRKLHHSSKIQEYRMTLNRAFCCVQRMAWHVKVAPLQPSESNHYATLGLDCLCTAAQIRAAYRLLAKRHHPDVNHGSPKASARAQRLNAAHEI